jgi:hypothetical protein
LIIPRTTKAKSTPIKNIPCRSTRNRSAPLRLGYDGQEEHGHIAEFDGTSLEWLYNKFAEYSSPPPSSNKTSVSDPDTLSFNEAMNNHNNIFKWMKAANNKIQSLQKMALGKKCQSPTPRLVLFREIVPGYFEISLSTLKAEFSALSSAMRTLLPSAPCSKKSSPASSSHTPLRRQSSVKSLKTTMVPSSLLLSNAFQPHEVLPGEVALLLAACV